MPSHKGTLGRAVFDHGSVRLWLDMVPPIGLDLPEMMLAAVPRLAYEAAASWSASPTGGRWTLTFTARARAVVSLADGRTTHGRGGHRSGP